MGDFTYQKWGIGVAAEVSSFRKHLEEYLQAHPEIKPISRKEARYPKVFELDYHEVDAARNKGYTVTEMIGLV